MGSFNKGGNNRGGGGFRGGRDSGRPNFQKKSWDNNRGGDREVTMHSAICSECGKKCEVPFRPTGDKPVYCSDCFGDKKEGGNSDRYPKKSFGNDRPREFRDSRESSSPRPDSNRGLEDVKKQVEMLNSKIDSLIKRFDVHSQAVANTNASKESLKEVVSRAQSKTKETTVAKPSKGKITVVKTAKSTVKPTKKPAAKKK